MVTGVYKICKYAEVNEIMNDYYYTKEDKLGQAVLFSCILETIRQKERRRKAWNRHGI
jgi:hypothetical protein